MVIWAAALPPVLGDRIQLQQVLTNRMINAIEAMTPATDRPRELWIRARRPADDRVCGAAQRSSSKPTSRKSAMSKR